MMHPLSRTFAISNKVQFPLGVRDSRFQLYIYIITFVICLLSHFTVKNELQFESKSDSESGSNSVDPEVRASGFPEI